MKYYYKIFVSEGVKESLKYIKADDDFIEILTENSNFKFQLTRNMEYFYVGYDVDQIRKGKSAWTWDEFNEHYRVNYNFKGDVRPTRSDKIKKIIQLWDNEDVL